MNYIPLTQIVQDLVAQRLRPGQYAIDATMGNGHDTVFLADSVGDEGQVFGFDIQSQALANTHQRLLDAGLASRVTLIHRGHEHMSAQIPTSVHGQVSAVMFNLGYLPGSNKNTITQPETTAAAIESAARLLARNGIMSILVYRGHAGGLTEADAVARILDSLSGDGFEISKHTSPGPCLYIIKKIAGAGSE